MLVSPAKDAEMKGADKASSGQGAQTVYRDKKGRKLDMLNEFMKSQDAKAGKLVGALGRSEPSVVLCALRMRGKYRSTLGWLAAGSGPSMGCWKTS